MSEINSVAGQLVGIPMGQVYTAGTGIKIDNVNKIVSVDETVLWSGTSNCADHDTIDLSEAASNFTFVDIYITPYNDNNRAIEVLRFVVSNKEMDLAPIGFTGTSGLRLNKARANFTNSYTKLSITDSYQITITGSGTISNGSCTAVIFKIVGISRIASN